MKILTLNLPFVMRDLIAEEAKTCNNWKLYVGYNIVYDMKCPDTISYMTSCVLNVWCLQVQYVNRAIEAAKEDQLLYGAELIEDLTDGIIRVHLAVVEYNLQCRKFGM